MSESQNTYQVFLHLLHDDDRGNWFSYLKDIFILMDKADIYDNVKCCNIDECKEILFQCAEKEWKQAVNCKPKLRSYKLFKISLQTEDYIKCRMSKQQRSLLARFRCGILQLRIETDRFTNIKLENRICQLCEENTVEDELHFLCQCTVYSEERNSL